MAEKKEEDQSLLEQIRQVVKDELKQGQAKNLPIPIAPVDPHLPTTKELKDHLCPGISDSDAFVFLQTAKLFGLCPFKKEIYLMPFKAEGKTRYAPVIDYHVFLARAKQYPTYIYFEVGLRYPSDANKKANGAWCKIYDEKFGKDVTGQLRFFYHEIDADEYDKEQATWRSHRNTMLKKTAIRQAHQLCYPELTGLPPIKDMLIVDASGTVVDNAGELPKAKSRTPKVDEEFFGQPSPKKEKAKTKEEPTDDRGALEPQLTALQKILEHPNLPTELGNELATKLDGHLTAGEASDLISKYQRAIIEAKKKKKLEQEEMPV